MPAQPIHFSSALHINANLKGSLYHHPWKNLCCQGRANEILRADVQDHLRWVQRHIGYKYIRFHAVFHDDMRVVMRRPDGSLSFQWHQVNKVYDFLLSIGLKPFVELSSMPECMTSHPHAGCYYRFRGGPPDSWEEWSSLIHEFAVHLLDRYGEEEVAQWYFEVWNEPNIGTEAHGFWAKGWKEYLELYRRAARELKAVSSRFRVGGPASASAGRIEDMIQTCQREDLPLDFISTHLYPQDEFQHSTSEETSSFPEGAFFPETVKDVRRTVEALCPGLEIHWTEWNAMSAGSPESVDWGHNPTNDNLFGAAFVCHVLSQLDDAAESMGYWIVSDIFDEWPIMNAPFSATYGMMTIHGFPKAVCNAFRFLARLRGPRLDISTDGLPPFANVMGSSEGDVIRLLLWNWEPLTRQGEIPIWSPTLRIKSCLPEARILSARIRKGQGCAWDTWQSMGCPLNLSPSEQEALTFAAEPEWVTCIEKSDHGHVTLTPELSPNEVRYVEIRPLSERAYEKGVL